LTQKEAAASAIHRLELNDNQAETSGLITTTVSEPVTFLTVFDLHFKYLNPFD